MKDTLKIDDDHGIGIKSCDSINSAAASVPIFPPQGLEDIINDNNNDNNI